MPPCVCGPNPDCAPDCPFRPKKRARRNSPEAQIQRAIVDRLRFHGVLCVSVPNEGKRSAIAGRAFKTTGMRPGFPDLICMRDGNVGFLEVKAPVGRLSPAQIECHAELTRHGMRVAVVRSQEDAVLILSAWGVIA